MWRDIYVGPTIRLATFPHIPYFPPKYGGLLSEFLWLLISPTTFYGLVSLSILL